MMVEDLKLGRRLRNKRPDKPEGMKPANLTKSQRMEMSVCGAQWSESMGQWLGFLFDGRVVTMFEGRTTRARALEDAHAHYQRIFHEERATKRWSRGVSV